ncbi:zinc ABC transporter substrate-binding protein [Corynebacterium pyruviciproducens]|uniref:metal ABC transporter substrate-binding protein n=1 Tax=Corynebacterium pyruviciproducens TaxID=598660 RepID=UPI002457843F|nr:metal ABC transporter substrate-binding protein [Corynebacterium pyruviciproducens]MDH4657541.1 zinc ABC transporter substrate-binding protein [Corynebacterium pyruviciproducens]MDK6565464.1 metal ABC transporter substrate-binding protein [Corynebacterium pyruviciproducens]
MNLLKKLVATGVAAATAVGLTACSTESNETAESPTGSLTVVASTGYLADAVHNIAPDAQITTLVKPGGDPHTQALTSTDVQQIEKADLMVWTSHDMEHKMMDQFDKLGDKSLPAAEAIPESDLLPWEEDGKIEGHDPHVWNSPDNWIYTVDAIAAKLATIDAANAQQYKDNAKAYTDRIAELKAYGNEKLGNVPADKRFLITGHDAFNYLGKTFGLEVLATDFVSSESELSAQAMDELAQTIVDHKVKVVFQDNLKNPEVIKHLQDSVRAKGGEVTISDQVLYADTLGETAPVDTYIGAFRHNIDAIAEALA